MSFARSTPAENPGGATKLPGDQRRGPLAPGDRVQITDPKGRLHTITLVPGGRFQTNRGALDHDAVLGGPDGQVVEVGEGRTFQVMRPRLLDYVLSMPRGAAIIYPKDAASIVSAGDIFPGATVLEAGVGSGGLALHLLDALGSHGVLHSVEKRDDFAAIARANVALWYGKEPDNWDLEVADLKDVLADAEDNSYDRVVLDLLDPWEHVDEVARVLRPGGVFTVYVATVPQMSRFVEAVRETKRFSETESFETMNRKWHVEGLAVRPDHRMIGHTGFLSVTRKVAEAGAVHVTKARPAPAAAGKGGQWDEVEDFSADQLGEHVPNLKRVRRRRRDLEGKVRTWVHGESTEDESAEPTKNLETPLEEGR